MIKQFARIVVSGVILSLILGPELVGAQVSGSRIEVVKTLASALPLDMSQFKAGAGAEAALFRSTLAADLERWGWFVPASPGKGAVNLAGFCESSGSTLDVRCSVSNTVGQCYLNNESFRDTKMDARRFAHRVADRIVEAVCKCKGVASTRIVMVGTMSGSKELYICDSDGQNMKRLTTDRSISLAPKWGPDADTVLYTSYLFRFPDLYMVRISSGSRDRIASYPGLNTEGQISPDGREIVLVLSKDGNPDLYITNLRGGQPMRLTRTKNAALASPTWSPDGSQIAFVAGTSGLPHVYLVPRSGGERRRITFRGQENVDPDWGSNGLIAYSSKRFGRYQICTLDPAKMTPEDQVTQEFVDHLEPSWAPDGRHLVYTRVNGYKSQVYILDTISKREIRLSQLAGDWSSPAWSPK